MAPQEEVTIYDIVKVLQKHRKLYWSVFVFVMLIGSLLIMSLPGRYQYVQVVKIANYFDGNKSIELMRATDEKGEPVQFANIDLAVNDYNSKHPDKPVYIADNLITIDYSGNAKITLLGKGSTKDKEFYADVFQNILKQIVATTNPTYEATKSALSSYLVMLQKQFDSQQLAVKGLNFSGGTQDAVLKTVLVQQLISKDAELGKKINQTKISLSTLTNTSFDSGLVMYKDKSISKASLLVLLLFVAFFSAFIVVFMAVFFAKLRKMKN